MAKHRHKRETNARLSRSALVAAPVAVLATVSAVTLGVVQQEPARSTTDLMAQSSVTTDLAAAAAARTPVVSRGESRAAKREQRQAEARQERRKAAREARRAREAEEKATRQAVRQADTKLWVTVELNLWDASTEGATKVGLLDSGDKVLVTGRERDGRQEVVVDGASRWVTAGYLSDKEPVEGISGECTNGTSVPSNVDPNIIAVHRAVCARWPQVTTYGTWRNDSGEHGQGRAVDIMISGGTGWEIADYLRANASALGVEYLIYAQKIWSVERGGEGWRGMSDRGSVTANHYDHVHVTVW